jgi:hypothetical protein
MPVDPSDEIDLNDPISGSAFQNANISGQYNRGQQGVFALNPLSTPKYAKNVGARDAEFRDTLARIYISLADMGQPAIDSYLATLPTDAATQSLAQVLLGANSKGGTGFVDFFLSQANEPFEEIMQIDKVMSDDYVVFFFGQKPPVFQYSGTLLNSLQDDFRGGFALAYQQLLRGTQMARRGALARLRYDSVIVSGTMFAHSQQLNADNELAVPFSFSFLVKEYSIITNLPYAKLTTSAYVKLAADAAIQALQPTTAPNTTQTTTAVATPPLPAAVSAAGAPQNTSVINTNQNSMQQTVTAGGQTAASVTQSSSPTSNILGTVDPNAAAVAPPAAP